MQITVVLILALLSAGWPVLDNHGMVHLSDLFHVPYLFWSFLCKRIEDSTVAI